MIKVAVCDDEKNIRSYLSSLVRKQNMECCVAEYASADEYLSAGEEYDVLILDIELDCPGLGMNGMELAGYIRSMELKKQPVIIFVTGYEQYVYDAFDVGAFQYLLKPVDEKKFVKVFLRAAEQMLSGAWKKRTLLFRHANESRAVPVDNIYYIESKNHKIALHLKDGVKEYYGKIGELEKELTGQFFRIHKGYLINLSYVDAYSRRAVTISNGDALLISKYKYEDFVKAYLDFMRRYE